MFRGNGSDQGAEEDAGIGDDGDRDVRAMVIRKMACLQLPYFLAIPSHYYG